jgi:A/G-specific adenine glycosylase
MLIRKIIKWYKIHKRDLPWRKTTNPYFIWISEMVCQQTAVVTAVPYYEAFIENFPVISVLADASENEVLLVWQGLGYYSRARNMHKSAQMIINQYSGKFPNCYDELIKLKGIGEYTAGAVASIAFGESKPAVDGNVYRVLSRIFGIFESSETVAGKRKFREKAFGLMCGVNPGDFNQSLMEFGALQCVPKKPDCLSCVVKKDCYAFNHNAVAELPVKKKKSIPENRYFYYFIIEHRGGILLKKRVNDDIWKSLYEFPLIESESKINPNELKMRLKPDFFGNSEIIFSDSVFSKKHKLSHLIIHAEFYHIFSDIDFSKQGGNLGFLSVGKNQISNFPVSQLIKTAIGKLLI